MRKLTILPIILVSAIAVGAQKVKVGADPGVDVSKYKTYAWQPGNGAVNPIVNQIIIEAVDQALVAKGLTKVAAKPEVTVAFFAAANSDLHIAYPSWSNAMGSAASTGIAVDSQSWTVTKGMLVVDIADAATKNTVWRGSASSALPHGPTGDVAKDAKSADKPIKKAVEKMFKKYPKP
jgi:hypothetical protein